MTALSPSEVAKIAASLKDEKSTKATHADVEAFVEALRAEVKEDGEDVSSALLALLEEAEDMLTWDEADLSSRESLTWE